tara:strand:+ start:53 stop:562 length:510 start_codon:yes stop_codon:yes gene_type:complete
MNATHTDILDTMSQLLSSRQQLTQVFSELLAPGFVPVAEELADAVDPAATPTLDLDIAINAAKKMAPSSNYARVVLFVAALAILLLGFYTIAKQENRQAVTVAKSIVKKTSRNFVREALRGNYSRLPKVIVKSVGDGVIRGASKAAMGEAYINMPPPDFKEFIRDKASV